MSGSRDWFVYISDTNASYAVQLDESNAEAGGFAHYVAGGVGGVNESLPKNLEMRYVYAVNRTTPAIKRRFYVGTITKLQALLAAKEITAETYPGVAASAWDITTYNGERRSRIPISGDTGLNDGDVEN